MLEIYTDGSKALQGNAIYKNGIGIHINNGPKVDMACAIDIGSADTGTIELIAICVALILSEDVPNVRIYSDCQHAVDPLTSRYAEFMANGWTTKQKKKIIDHEYFQECSEIIESRRQRNQKVRIRKVEGHSGNEGNNKADRLAYAAVSGRYDCVLHISVIDSIQKSFSNCTELVKIKNIIRTLNSTTEIDDERDLKQDSPTPINDLDHPNLGFSEWSKPLTGVNCDVDEVSESTEYHLFPLCIRHGGMIWIRYPSNHPINSHNGLGRLEGCSIIPTVCRMCITSHLDESEHEDVSKLMSRLKDAMNVLGISLTIIKTSKFGDYAAKISGYDQKILQADNVPSLIPITEISMKCDSRCNAVSIDMNDGSPLPYLQFGFL